MTKIHHATVAKAKKFSIVLSVEDNEIVATSKTGVRLASGLQGNKVLEDAITKLTGKAAKGKGNTPITKASIEEIGAKIAKAAPVEIDPYEEAAREDGWKKTRWGFSKEGEESVQAMNWADLCDHAGIEVAEDELTDDEETGTKSVVKAKYKAKYKPTKNRCGDELSHRMNEHCSREDDEDGVMKINLDALRKFAKANECWVESYASLKSRTGTFNGGMAMMNCNNRLRARLRRIAKEQDRPFNIDKDIVWK